MTVPDDVAAEQARVNLANWEDRVPVHLASATYVAGFVADPSRRSLVVAGDAPVLGDVAGRSLLHLRCHIGTDTLSWARLGARFTGLDFAPGAVEAARRIAVDAGLPARFVLYLRDGHPPAPSGLG